jgi:hypothetical protein
MSAPEAIAPVGGSAEPTRWSPGDVSKNQLYKSPQSAGDPRNGFVQSGEKLGCIHEGNTDAALKSFRKKVERVVLNALGFDWFSPFPSSSEKPIHLARGRFPELQDQCEAAQLARDAAQLG